MQDGLFALAVTMVAVSNYDGAPDIIPLHLTVHLPPGVFTLCTVQTVPAHAREL